MIKYIKHISDEVTLGVWEIDENIDQLKNQLNAEEFALTENYHPKKQAEFVTSRLLVKAMCHELDIPYQGLEKDEHGKPYFVNSVYHLSISHSHPMVAALIHQTQPCGIDIERPREQMLKIKHKFLNKQELEICADDTNMLGLHWSAKEAVYKVHGRKNLSFADHISIGTIGSGTIETEVKLGNDIKSIELFYEKLERYLLVYGYGNI